MNVSLLLAFLAIIASVLAQCAPPCSAGKTCCTTSGFSSCVDTMTDTAHCGACNSGGKALACHKGVAVPNPPGPVKQPTDGTISPGTVTLPANAAGNSVEMSYYFSDGNGKTLWDGIKVSQCTDINTCVPAINYQYTCRVTLSGTPVAQQNLFFLLGFWDRVNGGVATNPQFTKVNVGTFSSFGVIEKAQAGKVAPITINLRRQVNMSLRTIPPRCGLYVRLEFSAKKKRDLLATTNTEATMIQKFSVSSPYAGTSNCLAPNESPCNGKCVNFLTDPDNCGGCRFSLDPKSINYKKTFSNGACVAGEIVEPRSSNSDNPNIRFGLLNMDAPTNLHVPFGAFKVDYPWQFASDRPVALTHIHNGPQLPVQYRFSCQWTFQISSGKVNEIYTFWIGFQQDVEPINTRGSEISRVTITTANAQSPQQLLTRSIVMDADAHPPKCLLVFQPATFPPTVSPVLRVIRVESAIKSVERTGSTTNVALDFDGTISILPREP